MPCIGLFHFHEVSSMSNIRSTLCAIRQAKTVRELLAALPRRAVGAAATVLLCYLCLLPPLASLTYDKNSLFIFDSDAVSFLTSSTYPYTDHWYRLMSTVMILSLLFAAYAAARLYFQLRDARMPLRRWLAGHKAVLFFGLLFCWAVVSWALSGHRFRSFFGTGYRHDGLLTYLFYIGLFCMTQQLDRRRMRLVMEIFAAVGALLGLLCVFPGSCLAALFFQSGSGYTQSIFLTRTHYGYFLSLCVPTATVLLLTDEYPAAKPRRALCLAARTAELWLLVNALVYNSTRAALVGLAVTAVLLNAFVLRLHKDARRRILWVDALVLAAFAGLNTGNYVAQMAQRNLEYLGDVQATASGSDAHANALDLLTSYRYSMWRYGIKYALQRPLFGWGPDNLGELYFADGLAYTDRPHNEFIQIAATLGLPALGLYLCGLYHWLRPLVQGSRRLDLFDFGLAMVAVSYLVNSVFSNSMFYTTPYFYMFLGFAYKLCREA